MTGLTPLPGAELMRATDRWAIEERGVPSLDLMERAGTQVVRAAERLAPSGRVAVVAGKGNNGGDGLVVARLLRERGRDVDVLAVGDLSETKGDARANLERLPGAAPVAFSADALEGAALVVDAVLGTGFEGEPREPARGALRAMSECAAPVLAVDVPSGIDASSGEVAGDAARAACTVTFHAAKPGLWISPGKEHSGEVGVVDIGIPAGGPDGADVALIGDGVLADVPKREAGSTKFASGAVMVCGGSRGLTGAPCLACEAAQRTGAGYVTALVPRSLGTIFELRLLEAMSVELPDDGTELSPDALDTILARTEKADALVLGPGFGRGEGAQELVREVAGRVETPLVLDADGLNAHAGRIADLAARPAGTILTPHAGELGRLLDLDSQEIGARRLHHARAAAEQAQAVVVLKGDDTIVARPDGFAAVSPGGAPGLATAGTGDVLSGVLGALLAKGLDPFAAACAGVWLHLRAGQAAAERLHGPDGVIARDVIEALPRLLAA